MVKLAIRMVGQPGRDCVSSCACVLLVERVNLAACLMVLVVTKGAPEWDTRTRCNLFCAGLGLTAPSCSS